jgi:hypothetical protein
MKNGLEQLPDVMRVEYEAEMKEQDRFINREKRIPESDRYGYN